VHNIAPVPAVVDDLLALANDLLNLVVWVGSPSIYNGGNRRRHSATYSSILLRI
jgi:hypothetical protein